MRHLLTVLVLVALAATLSADSIILKSGTSLSGKIVAEHPDRVEIKLRSGEVRTVPRDEIAVLRKGESRLDEYRARLAAVADDDVEGLLDLAAWCDEEGMSGQRIRVLRKAVKAAPDCAEARRGLGEIWNGKSWTKDKKQGTVEPPVAGPKARCEPLGLEMTLPKGFTLHPADAVALRARGPERYLVPVVLDILESPTDPAARFSGKDAGWSKPVPVKHGPLEGLRAERELKEKLRRIRIVEHAYLNGARSFVVRLSALSVELDDWLPHLTLLLESLTPTSVRPMHVVARLGIGFDPPPGAGWSVQDSGVDDEGRLGTSVTIDHPSELATDHASIFYSQLDARDFGGSLNPAVLRGIMEALIQAIGSGGELREQSDTRLGSHAATLYDYDLLAGGIPQRALFVLAIEGSRAHLLGLVCHERSIDRFRPALDHVRKSFRTDVK